MRYHLQVGGLEKGAVREWQARLWEGGCGGLEAGSQAHLQLGQLLNKQAISPAANAQPDILS